MAYKFIYVDDAQHELEQGMIHALEADGDIKITFSGPRNWEDLIDFLKSELPRHDGIILDLRLDDIPFDGKNASYKGSTVAQELRNLTKENALPDFPILLFSGTDKLEHYLDQTSKDLFDKIIDKTKIESEEYLNYSDFRNILRWLADGYKFLSNVDRNDLLLVLAIEDISLLDTRFVETYNSIKNKPIHITAQFFLKEVLGRPSFLINEEILASRLGVDRSSQNWSDVLECFSDCVYKGAFAGKYNMWWMPKINRLWKERISNEINIRNISANKRVSLLKEVLNLSELISIKKSARSKSDSFWTICKVRKIAIDTIDGFVISGQDNKFPWQELEYISIDEALRPSKGINISSLEISRLSELKAIIENNEKRIRR
ncbi:hypothetical protein K2F45_11565 [Sphingobacterium siyangense]|uniref:hypothetical protein n=1 Tax=Sphingobacterium siyangense TaxID=459529 RepID=UPI00200F3C15|nr:hypothetical protein [Sphingobacterium siyangense]UQA77574.1 hypothetical protein K2F45_11565 [Sphingobacterium siyangense]